MMELSGRETAGTRLRRAVKSTDLLPFVGIYDVFSASLAARHFDALFVSGFGFAASAYGLPDIGFITWTDMVSFVHRLRTVLPLHHLLVDIDDGYCDTDVACHVVKLLESAGASGVVLEDQRRPRRCGHVEGKQILEIEEYVAKLRAVLASRKDLYVIARTDASDLEEIARRIEAFTNAGADAILVDGVTSLAAVSHLAALTERPFCFNQIAGGKSPPSTFTELRESGVAIAIYSTPCLFSAQVAIDDAMLDLKARDGTLAGGRTGLRDCMQVLSANLSRFRGA